MKHFLKENDFNTSERLEIFNLAADYKENRLHHPQPLAGQTWGMLFFKSSTRTRISFEVGLGELGAKIVVLDKSSMQIGRGESLEDTAKIFSRYLHGMVIRAFEHDMVEGLSQFGSIPIVNALTDFLHPCQIFSDVFTLAEKWGGRGDSLESVKGRKLVFFGDCCCNMANSWIMAASLFGLELVLCGPENFKPRKDILDLLESEGLEPGQSPMRFSFIVCRRIPVWRSHRKYWIAIVHTCLTKRKIVYICKRQFLPKSPIKYFFSIIKFQSIFLK
jgi:ornithine carbamoyltransferase